MKKIVTAAALAGTLAALAVTPALAADMLVKKAPPPPRAPVWSWTGFYVGANIGGGWANTDWFEDAFGSGGGGPPGFEDGLAHSPGVLGGGQIGFDYQNGWAVFGIQADADAAGIRGSTGCFPEVFGIPQSCTTKIDALGTVTGRFGVAFDRTLLYVLGGFAWEHERLNNPGFIPGGVSFNPEFSGTRSGATVGAGIEWALAGNWSAFVQYNYLGFGKRALVLRENDPAVALVVGSSFTEIIHEDVQVIKAGVNYRFNWGPGGSATPASAEPMAMKAPARVAALPSTNWTGFYIGANAGAAWERASLNSTLTSCPTCSVSFDPADQAAIAAAGSPTINTTNFTGGVEAGYNLQSGQAVYGIETDFDAFTARSSQTTVANFGPLSNPAVQYTVVTSSGSDWLFTARGRLGWTPSPNLLLFATGGLAVTDITVANSYFDGFGPSPVGAASSQVTKAGWTLGGGVESAVSRNLSFKVEYLYLDFGTASTTDVVTRAGFLPTPFVTTDHVTAQIVRAGLNYKLW